MKVIDEKTLGIMVILKIGVLDLKDNTTCLKIPGKISEKVTCKIE